MAEGEGVGERDTRYNEGQEEMAQEAEADETLEPGSMPGGPEWREEATEGPGPSDPLGEEHDSP